MHELMYSRTNGDANSSLIGRRECVINRNGVTRESVAFCTPTRNQIRSLLERSCPCSVCPKRKGEQETSTCTRAWPRWPIRDVTDSFTNLHGMRQKATRNALSLSISSSSFEKKRGELDRIVVKQRTRDFGP